MMNDDVGSRGFSTLVLSLLDRSYEGLKLELLQSIAEQLYPTGGGPRYGLR